MTRYIHPPSPRRRSDESAEGCALALVGLVVVPFLLAYDAWAFHLMWRWFVVPATNFNELGIWQSMGLLAIWPIIGFRYSSADNEVDEEDKPAAMGKRLGMSLMMTTLCLTIGWVVHTFFL
jgi:hypothetical protein